MNHTPHHSHTANNLLEKHISLIKFVFLLKFPEIKLNAAVDENSSDSPSKNPRDLRKNTRETNSRIMNVNLYDYGYLVSLSFAPSRPPTEYLMSPFAAKRKDETEGRLNRIRLLLIPQPHHTSERQIYCFN